MTSCQEPSHKTETEGVVEPGDQVHRFTAQYTDRQ